MKPIIRVRRKGDYLEFRSIGLGTRDQFMPCVLYIDISHPFITPEVEKNFKDYYNKLTAYWHNMYPIADTQFEDGTRACGSLWTGYKATLYTQR